MKAYIIRERCLFCKKSAFTTLLNKDYSIPIGCFSVNDSNYEYTFIPYNLYNCSNCFTVQTKYEGDLSLIYGESFAGLFGTTRSIMNIEFSKFILSNHSIKSVLEVGAGNGDIADILLEKSGLDYTIIDPSYWGNTTNRSIIKNFIENIDTSSLNSDTLVMSHVFEHFYDPMAILTKVSQMPNLTHIYINHPNLESFIKNGNYHVLNPEHIFYVETSFIEEIFLLFGFKRKRSYNYTDFAIFLEFERIQIENNSISFPKNINTVESTQIFFSNLFINIKTINDILEKTTVPVHIWPSSMHTNFVIAMGLNKEKIKFVLDNSPHKIGKYLYGYNLYCKSFKEITESEKKKIIILAGGLYNKEIIDSVRSNSSNIVYII